MWSAIKTDLTDFLTAENDSNSSGDPDSVNSLDGKLNGDAALVSNNADTSYDNDCNESPEEEAERLSGIKETFMEPLLVHDRSGLQEVSYDTHETSYESYESDDEEAFQVERFLESFDIESHANEIVRLLHPLLPVILDDDETLESEATGERQAVPPTAEVQVTELNPLQLQYQQLVQQKLITHEQFWTRYYFRCNPNLISQRRELKQCLAEQQSTQQLDIRTINQAAFNIGKSLFQNVSGAVGAVSESLGEATRELAYQTSGRPPFVIAAIDEDDDEYFEGEEEVVVSEEEASLTWEEESVADDLIHDEVAFVEGANTPLVLESLDVVRLRRTLMQMESERNTMMQMVEERNEEIVRLRCMLEEKCESTAMDKTVDELRDEVKFLQTIASLKSAEAALSELQLKIDALRDRSISSSLEASIQKEYVKQKDLQSELDEYKMKIEELQRKKQDADKCISRLVVQKK